MAPPTRMATTTAQPQEKQPPPTGPPVLPIYLGCRYQSANFFSFWSVVGSMALAIWAVKVYSELCLSGIVEGILVGHYCLGR